MESVLTFIRSILNSVFDLIAIVARWVAESPRDRGVALALVVGVWSMVVALLC